MVALNPICAQLIASKDFEQAVISAFSSVDRSPPIELTLRLFGWRSICIPAHVNSLSSRRWPAKAMLFARQTRWPVVVFQFNETGISQATAPGFEIVIGPVAAAVPAFDVGAMRVGAEQDAAGF